MNVGTGTMVIIVFGETYRVRDEIKAMGYTWDGENKQWHKKDATQDDIEAIDHKIYYDWNGVEREVQGR